MINATDTTSISTTYAAKICCDHLVAKLENGAPLTPAEEEHIHALYRFEKSASRALELSRHRGILTNRIV